MILLIAFLNFSASDRFNKIPISLIEKPRNSTFHDFLVCEIVTKPKTNIIYLSLETPGRSLEQQTPPQQKNANAFLSQLGSPWPTAKKFQNGTWTDFGIVTNNQIFTKLEHHKKIKGNSQEKDGNNYGPFGLFMVEMYLNHTFNSFID